MAKVNVKKAKVISTRKKSKQSQNLLKSALVARISNNSTAANVDFVFTSGLGQATASLFRNGILINMQSISSSGSIHFSNVQSGDSISINGVCAGGARISISVPTNPTTPDNFEAGSINAGYDIL